MRELFSIENGLLKKKKGFFISHGYLAFFSCIVISMGCLFLLIVFGTGDFFKVLEVLLNVSN